jgi:aerobic carbon-monoxide dehydrogenase medium subunit
MKVATLVTGAFNTAIENAEILVAVRIPRLPPGARWGYIKACRKPGEFAHAMAAVLVAGKSRRLVIGSLGGKPRLLEGETASLDGAQAVLSGVDSIDAVVRHMQLAVVRRALEAARA